MTQKIYQVVVVEDDKNTRDYLAESINSSPNLCVSGIAENCAQAIPILQKEPDIALIDLGLPDGSGLDLIRRFFLKDVKTEFVVLTIFGDEGHVIPALEAGACGYLLKDSAMKDIAALIDQVLQGGAPISSIIARKLLTRFRPKDQQDKFNLTNREHDVLCLMAKGYNYNETAKHLDISYHTVVSHVRNTYKKMEVNSRSEAVFEASRVGILKL